MHHQKSKLNQHGFHLIEGIIILAVLGAIGFIGFNVMNKNSPTNSETTTESKVDPNTTGPPVWEYNQDKLEWFVKSGAATKCEEPFKFPVSPVDMSKVTAVGLPGAYRGFSYKAHGGFRAATSTNGLLEVKMPIDANFRGVTRYYEAIPGYPDELQYLVTFENDCGIAFRFDHLQTLSPALQAYAEKSPPPKKDDTRGDPNAERISVPMQSGTVIATAVGFPSAKNYGFDFGVYDYRKPNEISKNKEWAKIHEMYSAQHFHGVCWLPMLPAADAAIAEALAKDRANYNANKPFNLISDYCDFAPHNTLDFNSGQPTDG